MLVNFYLGVEDVGKGHDVYRFRNYAVKNMNDSLDIVRIVSIEDQEHKLLESCKRADKDKTFFGRVYEKEMTVSMSIMM